MPERPFISTLLQHLRANVIHLSAFLFIAGLLGTAALAPLLATHDPNHQDYRSVLQGPSAEHWFGTDHLGRDVYSRIVYGARLSVTIGVLAVGLGALIGVALGLVSGYHGGGVDMVIMRVIDVFLAFPGILLALLIVAALGGGLLQVVFAIGLGSVPTFARLTRGAVMSTRQREFVEAARALGAAETRILIRHVLLNSFGPILVYATLLMGGAILSAAALSFIGVGVPPPAPEWGAMINTAKSHMRDAPHVVVLPGAALFLTVLAFNLAGDALRDVLDPKSR